MVVSQTALFRRLCEAWVSIEAAARAGARGRGAGPARSRAGVGESARQPGITGGYLFQTVSPSAPPEAGRPRGVQSRRRASISPHLKLPLLKVYYRAHPWPSPGPSGPSGARAGCRAAFRGVGTPKGPCGVECGGSAGPPQAARAWVRPALWAPQAELGAPGGGLRVRSCVDKQRPQRVPLGSTGQVGRGLCPQQPLTSPHVALGRGKSPLLAPCCLHPVGRGLGGIVAAPTTQRAPAGQGAAHRPGRCGPRGLRLGPPQATWGATEGRPALGLQLGARPPARCVDLCHVSGVLSPFLVHWLFSFTFGHCEWCRSDCGVQISDSLFLSRCLRAGFWGHTAALW